jgi:hypothetical protein
MIYHYLLLALSRTLKLNLESAFISTSFQSNLKSVNYSCDPMDWEHDLESSPKWGTLHRLREKEGAG